MDYICVFDVDVYLSQVAKGQHAELLYTKYNTKLALGHEHEQGVTWLSRSWSFALPADVLPSCDYIPAV